ncbi:type II secretion system protein N [Actimicrobium antarcticum]|uniref:Type II secretion system protein GspC N-terminal domain-containing protein n=1 Tax=Actimicrobium antarcticum TaxID=1051899 RepID=A0ABP7T7N1_9BURK
MKRLPMIVSFVLFIALCASATYWTLQFMKPQQRPMAPIAQNVRTDTSLELAAGLFGGRAAKVAVASNFLLKGVVVAGNGRESVAILVADGKPPQAIRVDVEVVPGVTVKEVHSQYVLLSEGGVVKRVELQESPKSSMQFQSPVQPALQQMIPQPAMVLPTAVPPQRTLVPQQQPPQSSPEPSPQAPMVVPDQGQAAPGMSAVTPAQDPMQPPGAQQSPQGGTQMQGGFGTSQQGGRAN